MKWQSDNCEYLVPNINKGDEIVFCYEYNDIQKNIYKYHKDSPDKAIYNLIFNYIELLKEYETIYKIKCIPLSIPPLPLPSNNGKYLHGIFGDFEALGSDDARGFYTRYTNKILKELCDKNKLSLLNIYDDINKDGFIKKEYTTDYVHLQYDNIELVEKIKIKINELLRL